uniref:C-type lectin domain-containing protein n=1 Tax=Labrus bergylta TaxID=56723 RepID=A0A3Q3EH48_9LABR
MKMLIVLLLVCAATALTDAAGEQPDHMTGESEEPSIQEAGSGDNETAVDSSIQDEAQPDEIKGEPSVLEGDVMAEGDDLTVQRSSGCPSGWTADNGRCFLYVPRAMHWVDAERNCQSQGGNLASVHSFDDYHSIQRMIASQTGWQPFTWIGGSDAQLERAWLWSDGSYFNFENWCRGQPDNLHNQDCLLMNFGENKCWDDNTCSKYFPSSVQRNFNPASADERVENSNSSVFRLISLIFNLKALKLMSYLCFFLTIVSSNSNRSWTVSLVVCF